MKEMEAKTENRYEYRKPQEKRKQMIAPDLFEFAYVPDWYGHLAELERLALPESWKFRKPSRETKNTDTPILERYIHTIFRKAKYYTPENKRNHTRKNNGEVQSYYILENHEPIVSPKVWEQVQKVREQRKRDRNIGQDSTMKFQNRYPLSGMLLCPYCGKTLRCRQVYKKKIQWLCSTYIEKGVKACKGIRIDDAELQGLNITEQTVIEEVVKNGKKHYCYTSKADFDCGIRNSTLSAEIEDGGVLPSVNRPTSTGNL